MITNLLVVLGGSMLLLTACSKEPAEQYRLSQDQLAWQGYQAGEVLRFSNSNNTRMRTYAITNVQDRMEEQRLGINWLPLPSKTPPQCQHLTVKVQRTDSVALAEYALDLELYLDQSYGGVVLQAEVGWDKFYPYARLPLDEINKAQPLDTLLYPKITLLPTATFGPTTYTTVIRAVQRYPTATGARATRSLYYAKGKGLVAFLEDGTGLWHRLP